MIITVITVLLIISLYGTNKSSLQQDKHQKNNKTQQIRGSVTCFDTRAGNGKVLFEHKTNAPRQHNEH